MSTTILDVGPISDPESARSTFWTAVSNAGADNGTITIPEGVTLEYLCPPIDLKNPGAYPDTPALRGNVRIEGDGTLKPVVPPGLTRNDQVELLPIDPRRDFDIELRGFRFETPFIPDPQSVNPRDLPVVFGFRLRGNAGKSGARGRILLREIQGFGDSAGLAISAPRYDGADEVDIEIDRCRLEGFGGCIDFSARTQEDGDVDGDGLPNEMPWQKRRIYVHDSDLFVRRGDWGYTVYGRQDVAHHFRNNTHHGGRRCLLKIATAHSVHKTVGSREFALIEGEKFVDCKGAVAIETDEYITTTVRGCEFPEELGSALFIYGRANIENNVSRCPWFASTVGENPQADTRAVFKSNHIEGCKVLIDHPAKAGSLWESFEMLWLNNVIEQDGGILFGLTDRGANQTVRGNSFRGKGRAIAYVRGLPARFNADVAAANDTRGSWGHGPWGHST